MTQRDKETEQSAKRIEPPEGWKLHSEHGFMRCGDGAADKLVRLADVVAWLMEKKELPCRLAVDKVCEALLGCAGVQVFIVSLSDHAKLVTQSDSFFYLPIIILDEQPTNEPDDVGLAGAVKWMRDLWGESSSPLESDYFGKHLLEPLSVRFDVAHELWGWGSDSGAAKKDEAQPIDKNAQLLDLLDAYEKRGPMTRSEFAKERCLTEANLKKLLGIALELRKKNSNNPFAGLVVVNGKKVAKK